MIYETTELMLQTNIICTLEIRDIGGDTNIRCLTSIKNLCKDNLFIKQLNNQHVWLQKTICLSIWDIEENWSTGYRTMH